MKRITIAIALLIAGASSGAAAQCAAPTRLSAAAITSTLTGKTVCGRPTPAYPGASSDRWQEEHFASGDLFDYKQGPCTLGTAGCVDPRRRVGTWSVFAIFVQHTYGGSASYVWTLHNNSTHYSFCNPNGIEVVRAFIQPGTNAACTAFPP